MDSDVIADRASQELVQIHEPSGYKWASVLRRDHHEVGTNLLGCLANASADVRIRHMHWFEFNTQAPSALHCGGKQTIGFAVATA